MSDNAQTVVPISRRMEAATRCPVQLVACPFAGSVERLSQGKVANSHYSKPPVLVTGNTIENTSKEVGQLTRLFP